MKLLVLVNEKKKWLGSLGSNGYNFSDRHGAYVIHNLIFPLTA